MYTFWLFLHLVGVSIGAGTGIYLGAVARHAEKSLEQAEARTLMPGVAGALSRVGDVGLALLLASGIVMIYTRGTTGLTAMFGLKMGLVAAILVYIGLMKRWARQARTTGDRAAALRMKKVSVLGPQLGVLTILAAVLAFN